MFEKLKQELFWGQMFDREWKIAGGEDFGRIIFRGDCISPREGSRWNKLFEGTRAIWKDQGQRRRASPRAAAFYAMQEIANDFYREFHNPDCIHREQVMQKIATCLWSAAPYDIKGLDGTYLSKDEHLGTPWKEYFEKRSINAQ